MVREDQVKAWRHVADDLGIDVEAPCEIALSDGTTIRGTALVKQFGAPKGTVAHPDHVFRDHVKALLQDGYTCSVITIPTVEQYRRGMMDDVLMDWGWCGTAQSRPRWMAEAFRFQSRLWNRIGAQLGVAVVAPWTMRLESGTEIVAAALIKNFGAEKGTLVTIDGGISETQCALLSRNGYAISYAILDPLEEGLEGLVYVLSEMGWSGAPEEMPAWLKDG